LNFIAKRPTASVSGGWVGVDKAWEQEKLEGRKKPKNSYSPHPSAARYVGRTAGIGIAFLIIVLKHGVNTSFAKK